MRRRLVIGVALILLVVSVATVWQISKTRGSIGNRVFVPAQGDYLLAKDFGPVDVTTPHTLFRNGSIVVEYSPSDRGETGKVVYVNGSTAYHIIIAMKGYFTELNYQYGTDYVELSCRTDVLIFAYAERFVFDIWIVPSHDSGWYCLTL